MIIKDFVLHTTNFFTVISGRTNGKGFNNMETICQSPFFELGEDSSPSNELSGLRECHLQTPQEDQFELQKSQILPTSAEMHCT